MPNPVVLKFEHFTRLSRHDKQQIAEACALRVRRYDPREVVIHEGDRPDNVKVVMSGWACRFKVLEDGRRQIMGYLVPGDFCDLKVFILKEMDHSIAAVTGAEIAELPVEVVERLSNQESRMAKALWWASLVNEAIEREWIVNVGQREAMERLGHLFCELYYRLRSVGLTDGNSYTLPVTQSELSEATGMSAVHVNRSLQELRGTGLLQLRGRTLTIPDLARLEQASLFTPNYLHLGREGAELDANDV